MKAWQVICLALFLLLGGMGSLGAQESQTNQAETYYAKGNGFLEKEDWSQAIENYLLAIAHNPQNMDFHISLAYAYYKMGQLEKAIQTYQSALPLAPADQQGSLYYNLGIVYLENNQTEAAINAFQQAIERQPDLVNAYHNLGALFYHQGELKKALYYYQTAQQLAPEDLTIQQDLQKIQERITLSENTTPTLLPYFSSSGLTGGLRLGTTPLTLGNDQGDFKKQIFGLVPQIQLNLEYEFGRWLGISDLAGLLTFGFNQPVQYASVPQVSVLSFDLETGITKQWRWTPWILNVTLKGGLLVGALLGAANLPDYQYGDSTTPTQGVWGLTPMVGLHYQVAPHMLIGLNAGWRFYWGDSANNQWEYQQRSTPGSLLSTRFPHLGSVGPVLQIIGNYGF